MYSDLLTQLWAHTKRRRGPLTTSCWVWMGRRSPKGYRQVRRGGKTLMVHVAAYDYFKGPPPEGQERDHLCKKRACWNPDHLEAVTHQINCSRGVGYFTLRSCCSRGHRYTKANLRWWLSKGGLVRRCRKCDNIYRENWMAKKTESWPERVILQPRGKAK